MENEDRERLYKVAQNVVQAPLSGLIAQCYLTLKANRREPGELSLVEFTQVFHQVCIGLEGVIFLMWDDETERYYSIHVPAVQIFKITEKPQPEENYGVINIGGPICDISLQVRMNVVEQGTAEELFDRTEDTRTLIQESWKAINRQYAVPTNHITPYDLCAFSNLYEITYRLTWFIIFMLNYKSPYNFVQTMGAALVDKYDFMSMSLFFNQSLQLFATMIRQPGDMEPFKQYIVKGYADYHLEKPDDKLKKFVADMYSGHGFPVPDMEPMTVINSAEQPNVSFMVATPVFVGG